jgi:hypothetical protein
MMIMIDHQQLACDVTLHDICIGRHYGAHGAHGARTTIGFVNPKFLASFEVVALSKTGKGS